MTYLSVDEQKNNFISHPNKVLFGKFKLNIIVDFAHMQPLLICYYRNLKLSFTESVNIVIGTWGMLEWHFNSNFSSASAEAQVNKPVQASEDHNASDVHVYKKENRLSRFQQSLTYCVVAKHRDNEELEWII